MYKCLICKKIYPNNGLIGYCTCGGDLEAQPIATKKVPPKIVLPVEPKANMPTKNETLLQQQLHHATENLKSCEAQLVQRVEIQKKLLAEIESWKASSKTNLEKMAATYNMHLEEMANHQKVLDAEVQHWKMAYQTLEIQGNQKQMEVDKLRANEVVLQARLRKAESPIPVLWEVAKNKLKKITI